MLESTSLSCPLLLIYDEKSNYFKSFFCIFLLSYITLGYEKYLLCLAYIYFRNLYNPNEGTELLARLDEQRMKDAVELWQNILNLQQMISNLIFKFNIYFYSTFIFVSLSFSFSILFVQHWPGLRMSFACDKNYCLYAPWSAEFDHN